MLKAALNGDRKHGSHPALPLGVDELTADAAACVRAGAAAIHIHPRDTDGRETLAGDVVDETVRSVRLATGVAVGVSTGAWIEPDPMIIDGRLDRLGIAAPRLHHGEEGATWPVLRQAVSLGRDIRIGLEDTLLLPDGTRAPSNEALVRAAARLAGSA